MATLWVAAWSHAMPEIDFAERRAWFVDRIGALQAKGAVISCVISSGDEKLAGFITREGSGYIDQFCIAVGAWGSGAATTLLDDAKRSRAPLSLEVNQANVRAVRFYEREGFRRVGEGPKSAAGLATWRYEWRDFSPVG